MTGDLVTDGGLTGDGPTGDGAAGQAPAERFSVVVNDEEQYSLWPADQRLPAGWRAEGFVGSREACLAHVETVWVDMRPRSVRLRQEQNATG